MRISDWSSDVCSSDLLRPLIAFTEGHAICGLWLQPQTLPSLITDDPAELRKHIDLKELLLFETTLVTHKPRKSFSRRMKTSNGKIPEAAKERFSKALNIASGARQQFPPPAPHRWWREGAPPAPAAVTEGR